MDCSLSKNNNIWYLTHKIIKIIFLILICQSVSAVGLAVCETEANAECKRINQTINKYAFTDQRCTDSGGRGFNIPELLIIQNLVGYGMAPVCVPNSSYVNEVINVVKQCESSSVGAINANTTYDSQMLAGKDLLQNKKDTPEMKAKLVSSSQTFGAEGTKLNVSASECVNNCCQNNYYKHSILLESNCHKCNEYLSKAAGSNEMSVKLATMAEGLKSPLPSDSSDDKEGTKWGEVGKQMLVGAAPGIAGSLIPGALSLLGQRKPDKMPTQQYEFGECEKNPNSPECYCRQHGYAPPECKPYAGSESSRRSSLQTDGTDVDQAVKDALEAARLAAELEKNKAAPKKDQTDSIPGGGGGDSLGSSRVGSGAPLDDGKKKNAPALAAEVPVGSSSVRGYSYGGGTNSPFIADRSNLYGNLPKPGNNFGDLKEFLPKGMANDRSRMPAGMVVEVTGANGLSNFEKIRRRYKDRCPLMKKEFCI